MSLDFNVRRLCGAKMRNSLPWPSEYRGLFVQGGGYYEFARLRGGDIEQQFGRYCKGYKESADRLIDDAIASKEIARLDTVVFPAFFLYRQFIELSLKQTIVVFSPGTWSERIATLKELNHDLVAMWKKFIKVLPEVKNGYKKTTLEVVGKYIQEFSKIDKYSFSFRYPITKELDLIFGEEKSVNLRHVKDRMAELEAFFVGVDAYVDQLRTFRNEMRAEFENDFYHDCF